MKTKKKQYTQTNWSSDIQNWTKISEKTGELILSQVEKSLSETIETSKQISSKADKILTILIPFITSIMIYLISVINGITKTDDLFKFLPITAVVSLIMLIVSMIYCYLNYKEYELSVTGYYPNRIAISDFIDNNSFSSMEQYTNMILWICENTQKKIEYNDWINSKRMRNNTLALTWLQLIPLSPIISFILMKLSAIYLLPFLHVNHFLPA